MIKLVTVLSKVGRLERSYTRVRMPSRPYTCLQGPSQISTDRSCGNEGRGISPHFYPESYTGKGRGKQKIAGSHNECNDTETIFVTTRNWCTLQEYFTHHRNTVCILI